MDGKNWKESRGSKNWKESRGIITATAYLLFIFIWIIIVLTIGAIWTGNLTAWRIDGTALVLLVLTILIAWCDNII